MYSSAKLEEKLVFHEGIKKFAYTDTLGNITVGVGRCLQDKVGKGLLVDEIWYLLRNDINDVQSQLQSYSWFKNQNDVRRDALIELCFNMGLSNLLKFKKMLAALDAHNYSLASRELLDSLWSTQVGVNRSKDLASRISAGLYL